MKRTVTGPNGIMVVYGNEHLSDDHLKQLAASAADLNAHIIQQARKELFAKYVVTKTEDDAFGTSQKDDHDELGASVARAYNLPYGGVFKPAKENVVIFTMDDTKYRINVDASKQKMRDELTSPRCTRRGPLVARRFRACSILTPRRHAGYTSLGPIVSSVAATGAPLRSVARGTGRAG